MIKIKGNTNDFGLNDTEISVLKVMHSKLIYGKNHKKIETIMRSGFPKHIYGDVKKAIKSLIKKDYILWYDKSRKAIHLNKDRFSEIGEITKK